MEGFVGVDFVAGIFWEDGDGPVTGLTDSVVTITDRANGLVVADGFMTENPPASGYYEYVVDNGVITAPARWRLVYQSVSNELYAEHFITVGYARPEMRRRREIRNGVARRLWPKRATLMERVASGATQDEFTLSRILAGGVNQYRGMWARFSQGANRGQARQIITSTAAPNAIRFVIAPPLPVAPAFDDWVEVYEEDPLLLDNAIDDAWSLLSNRTVNFAEEQVFECNNEVEYFQLPSDARYVYSVRAVHVQTGDETPDLNPKAWSLHAGGKLRVVTPRQAPTDHTIVMPSLENPFGWRYTGSRPWPGGYELRVKLLAATTPPLYDESLADVDALPFIELATTVARLEQASRGDNDRAAAAVPVNLQRQGQMVRRLARQMPTGARTVLW